VTAEIHMMTSFTIIVLHQ